MADSVVRIYHVYSFPVVLMLHALVLVLILPESIETVFYIWFLDKGFILNHER